MSTSCSTTLNNTDTINMDTIHSDTINSDTNNTETGKRVQDLKTLQKQYEKYFKKAVPEEYEDDGAWIRWQVCLKKHRLLYAKYYGKTLVGRWANDVAWMRSKIIKARKKKEAQPSPRITMDEDLPGWTIRSVIRENGKQAGQTYKMYYSPSGQCYRSRVQALRALQAEHDHAEALVDNADGVRKTGKRKHSDMTRDTRTNENNLSEQNTFQEMEYSDESSESSDESSESSDEQGYLIWEDKCPKSDAGRCIYVALQKLLGCAAPTIKELDAQIDPIFKKRRKTEIDLAREDCGREGDTWCMEVVERALSLKHKRNLIFKKVQSEDIEGSHLPLLVIGTLNRACGFKDDGLPESEWCHAVAVVSSSRPWDSDEALAKKRWAKHGLLWCKATNKALIELKRNGHRITGAFLQRVVKRNVPTYHDAIARPMCLMDIERRLEKTGKAGYGSIEEYCADVRLIIANSLQFNAGNAEMVQLTGWFKEAFDAELSRLAAAPPWREEETELEGRRKVRLAFDNIIPETGLAVSKLISGKPHPYLKRVFRRYHIALKETPLVQDTRTNEHDLSKQTMEQSGESKDCCDETVEDPDATLTEIDVSEDETENNVAPLDQMPMTDEEMQQKLHKDFQEAKGKYGDFILAECLKHRPDIARKLDVERALAGLEAVAASLLRSDLEAVKEANFELQAQLCTVEVEAKYRGWWCESHELPPPTPAKLCRQRQEQRAKEIMRQQELGERERYFSQNVEMCPYDFDIACGPVTLANALLLTHGIRAEPKRLLDIARRIGIITTGTSGLHLKALSRIALYVVGARPLQQVTIRSVWDLKPGDIFLVNGVSLKNAHSKLHNMCNFEEASGNHFAMVEEVQKTHVTVINPDTRPCDEGCLYDASKPCTCYKDGMWGRMTLTICDMTRLMGLNRPTGATAAVLRFYCSYR
jgi:hypothetical protein